MKLLLTLFLLQISTVASVTHSRKEFYTYISLTEVPKLPEFLVFTFLDGVQIIHYDSDSKKAVPKQDWLNKITDDYPSFWMEKSAVLKSNEEMSHSLAEDAKPLLNFTGDVFIVQGILSCEWDDETDEVNKYNKFGYDGEDFIFLDTKTSTWIALRSHAAVLQNLLDNHKQLLSRMKTFNEYCDFWLKKFLNYGESSLMRKDLPSVSLLQKTPSSPVTCHATGFYPDKADLFWTNDGVELHENVVRGKILPNHDGTFQTRVDLDLKEVKEEDWWRYRCVFQLSGVHEVITPLDKHVVMLPPLPEKGFPLEYVFFISFGIFCLFFVLGYFTVPYIQKRNRLGFGRVNAHGSSLSSEP
ncbi:unnamed protein product [Ophioblennius macclurei]